MASRASLHMLWMWALRCQARLRLTAALIVSCSRPLRSSAKRMAWGFFWERRNILRFSTVYNQLKNFHSTISTVSYLPETGHGLAGDDLIAVEAGHEAQGLVLVLPSFQLAQDQRSEYFHILKKPKGREMKKLNRWLPESIGNSSRGKVMISCCLYEENHPN